jgi:hypothetical protein
MSAEIDIQSESPIVGREAVQVNSSFESRAEKRRFHKLRENSVEQGSMKALEQGTTSVVPQIPQNKGRASAPESRSTIRFRERHDLVRP